MKEFHQFNFESFSAFKFFQELCKAVFIRHVYLGLLPDGDTRRVTSMQLIK
jgi:hypothetical protein